MTSAKLLQHVSSGLKEMQSPLVPPSITTYDDNLTDEEIEVEVQGGYVPQALKGQTTQKGKT